MNPDVEPGDRVVLVRCTDPYTRIKRGTRGTVTSIDDLGTVHVNWDDGARLGMVEDAGDRFDLLRPNEPTEEGTP